MLEQDILQTNTESQFRNRFIVIITGARRDNTDHRQAPAGRPVHRRARGDTEGTAYMGTGRDVARVRREGKVHGSFAPQVDDPSIFQSRASEGSVGEVNLAHSPPVVVVGNLEQVECPIAKEHGPVVGEI